MEEFWKWVAGGALTLWLGLLQFMGLRELARLKALEDNKADKSSVDDLKGQLSELMSEMKSENEKASTNRKQIHDLIREATKQSNDSTLELTRAVSRLEGRIRNGGNNSP